MKSKKTYQKNDKVLVNSFCGTDVWVILKERILKPEKGWGADGWNAQITNQKEVNKLRKHGVPYKKGEKPMVWVFDWQIIKK